MDDAMAARLLATYGAPPTPENVAAAKNFFASNPDVAEHRAMGMRGSAIDDNSDVFRPMLDRLMQQTASPAAAAPPAPMEGATTPAAARSSPVVTQRPAASSPMGPQLPMASGAVNPLDAPPAAGAPASSGGSGWEWLLALLGASRAAAGGAASPNGNLPTAYQGPEARFVGPMGNPQQSPMGGEMQLDDMRGSTQIEGQQGRIPGARPQVEGPRAQLEAPQGRIANSTPDYNYESVGKEVDQINNRNTTTRNARTQQLQSEVDAENAQAQRLMEQMRNKQRGQANTRDLLKQGGKVLGRR